MFCQHTCLPAAKSRSQHWSLVRYNKKKKRRAMKPDMPKQTAHRSTKPTPHHHQYRHHPVRGSFLSASQTHTRYRMRERERARDKNRRNRDPTWWWWRRCCWWEMKTKQGKINLISWKMYQKSRGELNVWLEAYENKTMKTLPTDATDGRSRRWVLLGRRCWGKMRDDLYVIIQYLISKYNLSTVIDH